MSNKMFQIPILFENKKDLVEVLSMQMSKLLSKIEMKKNMVKNSVEDVRLSVKQVDEKDALDELLEQVDELLKVLGNSYIVLESLKSNYTALKENMFEDTKNV